MSADLTWKLNGVDLDSDPGFLTSVSVWRPNLSTRRTPIVIPGLHGSVDAGLPVFDEPTVTLSVRVSQTSQQALEQAVNNLVRLAAQSVLTLTRVSGGITASAAARLVSANFEDFLVGATERLLIVLAVPGVFFREDAQTSAQQGFAADVSNAPVGHLGGSTGPIRDAVVQVQGPATAVQVSDPASGTGISWTGSLAAGAFLYIDPASLSAWISASASDWSKAGTDATAGVDYPPAGPLALWPRADGQVWFSAAGTGRTSATRIALRAGRSFL